MHVRKITLSRQKEAGDILLYVPYVMETVGGERGGGAGTLFSVRGFLSCFFVEVVAVNFTERRYVVNKAKGSSISRTAVLP